MAMRRCWMEMESQESVLMKGRPPQKVWYKQNWLGDAMELRTESTES